MNWNKTEFENHTEYDLYIGDHTITLTNNHTSRKNIFGFAENSDLLGVLNSYEYGGLKKMQLYVEKELKMLFKALNDSFRSKG